MKNESLTPNPSPKGEGSKMKNQELRTFRRMRITLMVKVKKILHS